MSSSDAEAANVPQEYQEYSKIVDKFMGMCLNNSPLKHREVVALNDLDPMKFLQVEFQNFAQQEDFSQKAFTFCIEKNEEEIETATAILRDIALNEPTRKKIKLHDSQLGTEDDNQGDDPDYIPPTVGKADRPIKINWSRELDEVGDAVMDDNEFLRLMQQDTGIELETSISLPEVIQPVNISSQPFQENDFGGKTLPPEEIDRRLLKKLPIQMRYTITPVFQDVQMPSPQPVRAHEQSNQRNLTVENGENIILQDADPKKRTSKSPRHPLTPVSTNIPVAHIPIDIIDQAAVQIPIQQIPEPIIPELTQPPEVPVIVDQIGVENQQEIVQEQQTIPPEVAQEQQLVPSEVVQGQQQLVPSEVVQEQQIVHSEVAQGQQQLVPSEVPQEQQLVLPEVVEDSVARPRRRQRVRNLSNISEDHHVPQIRVLHKEMYDHRHLIDIDSLEDDNMTNDQLMNINEIFCEEVDAFHDIVQNFQTIPPIQPETIPDIVQPSILRTADFHTKTATPRRPSNVNNLIQNSPMPALDTIPNILTEQHERLDTAVINAQTCQNESLELARQVNQTAHVTAVSEETFNRGLPTTEQVISPPHIDFTTRVHSTPQAPQNQHSVHEANISDIQPQQVRPAISIPATPLQVTGPSSVHKLPYNEEAKLALLLFFKILALRTLTGRLNLMLSEIFENVRHRMNKIKMMAVLLKLSCEQVIEMVKSTETNYVTHVKLIGFD